MGVARRSSPRARARRGRCTRTRRRTRRKGTGRIVRRTLPLRSRHSVHAAKMVQRRRGYRKQYSKHHPEKDGADGHSKREGEAVQVVHGSRRRANTRVRVQVRAAPWIARSEPHDGGAKGGEKGRTEGTYRQPVAASPTPCSTGPRPASRTPKLGAGEGGEGVGGGGGAGS